MNRFLTYVLTPFKNANPVRIAIMDNVKHIVNLAGAIRMKLSMKKERMRKNPAAAKEIAVHGLSLAIEIW